MGYVAFHPGWLEHLYILPDHQGRGLGPVLDGQGAEDGTARTLWTFQKKNARARAFYEKHGWTLVKPSTARKQEKEPGRASRLAGR